MSFEIIACILKWTLQVCSINYHLFHTLKIIVYIDASVHDTSLLLTYILAIQLFKQFGSEPLRRITKTSGSKCGENKKKSFAIHYSLLTD